jgi:hypothetical protein
MLAVKNLLHRYDSFTHNLTNNCSWWLGQYDLTLRHNKTHCALLP